MSGILGGQGMESQTKLAGIGARFQFLEIWATEKSSAD
jgi:hypothetical protein